MFWSILNLASEIFKFLKTQLGATRLSSLILGQPPSRDVGVAPTTGFHFPR